MTDRLAPSACRRLGALALGAMVAAAIAVPAQADDEASPEDRARIAEALQAEGYESFEEVEFDDGVWDVDDAVGSDGREYDLRLDPDTLEIIERDDDD